MPTYPKHLTIDEIYHPERKLNLDQKPVEVPKWLDEEHYLQQAPGEKSSGLLKVNVHSGKAIPLWDVRKLERSLVEALGLSDENARKLATASGHRINAGQTEILIHHEGHLFSWNLDGHTLIRLAEGIDKDVGAEFSPDGRLVSFIRENNIAVVDPLSGNEWMLTTEGRQDLLLGRLDWVYQEEVYGRGKFRGYWWSPDSSRIAFLCLDESPVQAVHLTDHVARDPEANVAQEVVRYPRAGQPNPKARLAIVDIGNGSLRWIDTSKYDGLDHLIVRVEWTPESDRLSYQVQNREQTWLDLNFGDPASGRSRTAFRETSKAWVSVLGNPRWLADGGFLWLSERTGWRHVYLYDQNHRTVSTITSGPWDVRELHGIDEVNELVFFSGTKDSSIRSQAYRIKLDGTSPDRLTGKEASHEVAFSPAWDHFVDSSSNLTTTTRVQLHARDGQFVRVIDRNENPLLTQYEMGQTEFLEVKTGDGFVMDALMIKPPRFDPDKQYPVLTFTYGGPAAQQVRDAWGGTTYLWHQMLAGMGYIIWVCDNRSASSKGAQSAWPVYRNFGELELADLESGLDWLKTQSYVDASRIGIWGWSFGGYMTAYALTHSTSFKVGIAGAPVTDWRLYDTVYTERYMATPQSNPEGYERSSLLNAAGNLHGKLLLLHGTMDDNVHVHHSLQFMLALQKAGKQFDSMLYPTSRHRIEDPAQVYHLRTLMTNFIQTHL